MNEKYSLDELKNIIEHEKYLRKENQQLYEELQALRKGSDTTNDLANEYYKRIKNAIDFIEERDYYDTLESGCEELKNILKGD